MDVQGAEKARPYVEKAGATFTTLVDQGNRLGQLFGFKAIPNGILVDETGVIRYKKLGGFDIRRDETAHIVDRWAAGSVPDAPATDLGEDRSTGGQPDRAMTLFRDGLQLYKSGDVEHAIARWRDGLELDPGNYIIRKQIWAVENPDRFYAGDVDYAWQREQTAKGR